MWCWNRAGLAQSRVEAMADFLRTGSVPSRFGKMFLIDWFKLAIIVSLSQDVTVITPSITLTYQYCL